MASVPRPILGSSTTQLPVPTADMVANEMAILRIRLILAALAFAYAPFIFAFAYLHIVDQNNMWMPAGVTHPSMAVGVINCGLVLISGLVYLWGQMGLRTNDQTRFRTGMWVSFVLGLAAIAGNIVMFTELATAFNKANNFPTLFAAGGYASVFVSFTIAFCVLLFCTVVVLLGIANRGRLGYYTAERAAGVNATGELLGFVAALSLIVYLLLYIIPFIPVD